MTPNAKRGPEANPDPVQISSAGMITSHDSRGELILVESLGTVMTLAEFRDAVAGVLTWAAGR